MSKNIKLQHVIMNIVEVVMRCHPCGCRVICRVLYRCEVFRDIFIRNDDNTTWMLTGCTFDVGTSSRKVFLHRFTHIVDMHLFGITGYITESCLFRHGTDGTGTECMAFSEYFLDELMSSPLIFIGEIQVDIRNLIGIEAKECLEWNIMTIALHDGTTVWTYLVRQVKSALDFRIINPLTVVAVWTQIMRNQRIDFGNTGHGGGKGGSNRTS